MLSTMRIRLGELRRIIREVAGDKSDRLAMVADLIRRHPELKPIEGHLGSEGAIIHDSEDGRNGAIDARRLHAILAADPTAVAEFEIDPPRKGWGGENWEFVINRRPKRSRAGKSAGKKSFRELNVKPSTSFKKAELARSAKMAGKKLYGGDRSGLIWLARSDSEITLQKTSTYKMAIEQAQNLGEDALDVTTFTPTTFEFVFFPSRPGDGLDAADMKNFVEDAAEMTDSDGNIYLASNEGETLIRVVNPTIKDLEAYGQIVQNELEKEDY